MKKSLKIPKGNQNPYIEEEQRTQWPKELEAQWTEPVSLTFHSALRKINTEPSIGASHQISVHFGKAVSGKKILRNQPIKNKNCLWWPCLLRDRNEMSNRNRGLSIDASIIACGCYVY